MTPKEMAARLHGRQYRSETTLDDQLLAHQHGLVIVYGASDDLVELEGGIADELGANNGTKFWVTPKGLLEDFDQLCEERNEKGLRRRGAAMAAGPAGARTVYAQGADEFGAGPIWPRDMPLCCPAATGARGSGGIHRA
jgi:hypothetical protein